MEDPLVKHVNNWELCTRNSSCGIRLHNNDLPYCLLFKTIICKDVHFVSLLDDWRLSVQDFSQIFTLVVIFLYGVSLFFKPLIILWNLNPGHYFPSKWP